MTKCFYCNKETSNLKNMLIHNDIEVTICDNCEYEKQIAEEFLNEMMYENSLEKYLNR